MSQVNVLGAGAFGTALAISLAKGGNDVCLIARNPDQSAKMETERVNTARLPGIDFPQSLQVSTQPYSGADACLIAVPTDSLSELMRANQQTLSNQILVACCKGVDIASGQGPTEIIDTACPSATAAILSGPSFAIDIANGLPTALTIAAQDDETARSLQKILQFSNIRLYSSTDVVGVELGGALKNVIAIAAGICIGAGLGESARAALITRGFREIEKFAVSQGAQPKTLAGLSGLGDLILTCASEKSRNFCYGLALGKGEKPNRSQTVEGTRTAVAVDKIAELGGLDLPITSSVAALLANEITIQQSIATLLARPIGRE